MEKFTTLTRTTSENKDFQNLILQLDQLLQIVDGDQHSFFAQFNTTDDIKNVIVFYQNQMAIGCGAFKAYDTTTVEIKRMFVVPTYRGKGVASKILSELELWATELNYTMAILETGMRLQNAIALYKKSGYRLIEKYGQYKNVESSVCMQKML